MKQEISSIYTKTKGKMFSAIGGGGDSALPRHRSENGTIQTLDAAKILGIPDMYGLDFLIHSLGGIKNMREDARWPNVAKPDGTYDFSSLQRIVDASKYYNTNVKWSLMHYGYPDHVDPRSADFPKYFTDYGMNFFDWLKKQDALPKDIYPVVELSYYCWAGSGGMRWAPYGEGECSKMKENLVQGIINLRKETKKEHPRMKFWSVDPVFYAVGDIHDPRILTHIIHSKTAPYEAMDWLTSENAIDGIGANIYTSSQRHVWIDNKDNFHDVELAMNDPRRMSTFEILRDIYDRYHLPIEITETSINHPYRKTWLEDNVTEIIHAIDDGIPIESVVWYPSVGFAVWGEADRISDFTQIPIAQSGLFDNVPGVNGYRSRKILPDLLETVIEQNARLEEAIARQKAKGGIEIGKGTIFDFAQMKQNTKLPIAA